MISLKLQPVGNMGHINLRLGGRVWTVDRNLRVISIQMGCETRYYIQSQWGKKEPKRGEEEGRRKMERREESKGKDLGVRQPMELS